MNIAKTIKEFKETRERIRYLYAKMEHHAEVYLEQLSKMRKEIVEEAGSFEIREYELNRVPGFHVYGTTLMDADVSGSGKYVVSEQLDYKLPIDTKDFPEEIDIIRKSYKEEINKILLARKDSQKQQRQNLMEELEKINKKLTERVPVVPEKREIQVKK